MRFEITDRWTFCFPLARESRPFRRRNPVCRTAVLGVGATSPPGDAAGVVIAGYAGALRDGWSVGDVLVASEVVDADGATRRLHVPAELAGVRRGRLLTWPHLVATPAEKRVLAERFAADAVDMETAAVAAACAERGVPCVAVRAISDGPDDALSPELVRLIADGRVRVGAVLASLACRPRLLPELLHLNRATNRAGDALAEALSSLAGPR